ncbi:MAG: bifunctional nuclease family protein [Gemmatimonadales bacterium]
MTVAQLGVDRNTSTPVVILKETDGERTLPIWIGAAEAAAIAIELRGDKPARPMTHDLLKNLLQGLGGDLKRVHIAGLKDNTYIAQLVVIRGGEIFELDARPSDSIALALRTRSPIFAHEDLLDKEKEGDGEVTPPDSPQEPAEALRQFLSKLNPEDLGRFQP